MKTLGPVLLRTAATATAWEGSNDDDGPLALLHAVSTVRLGEAGKNGEAVENGDDDEDILFSVKNVSECAVSPREWTALLDVFLVGLAAIKR